MASPPHGSAPSCIPHCTHDVVRAHVLRDAYSGLLGVPSWPQRGPWASSGVALRVLLSSGSPRWACLMQPSKAGHRILYASSGLLRATCRLMSTGRGYLEEQTSHLSTPPPVMARWEWVRTLHAPWTHISPHCSLGMNLTPLLIGHESHPIAHWACTPLRIGRAPHCALGVHPMQDAVLRKIPSVTAQFEKVCCMPCEDGMKMFVAFHVRMG